MTLVILALAACALTRMATRSLELVRRGAVAQKELQQRWGGITARTAIVDQAEDLLLQAEAEQRELGFGWPFPSECQVQYTLGDCHYRLFIADEDSKINLNAIQTRKPEKLPSLLVEASVQTGIPLRLRPHLSSGDRASRPFESWGQVVDLSRISPSDKLADHLYPLSSTWTCWGKGKLNIRRSSDAALRIAVDDLLQPQETEDLLEARRDYDGELEELLKTLDIPRIRQIRARSVLTDESNVYSAWLIAESDSVRRECLFVEDPSLRGAPEVLQFEW